MTRAIWLLPLLLTCFIPGTRLPAQDAFFRPAMKPADISAGLSTDWYGLYLKGTKNGYFRTTREKVDDTYVESFVLNMKVVSMDIKVEVNISQSLTFESKPPYRLLKGVFRQDDGANKLIVTATRTGDKNFEHVAEIGGQKRTRKVEDLDYTLADAMASEIWLRSGPKIGAGIVGKDLELQEWKTDETKYVLTGVNSALVGGLDVKYYEVESQSKKDMIKVLSRNDEKGNLLQGTIGGVFELRKETEAQAKNTKYSQDLFVLGQAKIDRKIGSPLKLTELVLEVDGKIGEIFENGPRQTITLDRPGVRQIKLGKKFSNEIKPTAKEIEECLAETTAYAIKDAKVIALAQKAIGDAKTPEQKVERIVTFVHGYITGLPVATLPNIHDLLEKKQGDCKSYALMTTNLCRAVGIPARDVSGLVYMGDSVKAFGGHAWNEVVLNGAWLPVDASRGQFEIDAGHISFGPEYRANRNLLESLGKLSFRVVESKTK